MKRIEELGITPWPWHAESNTIIDDDGDDIYCEIDAVRDRANANLAAAAPELYEGLREAILAECIGCRYCGPHPKYECDNHDCRQAPAKWRAALAKAAHQCIGNCREIAEEGAKE